MAKRTHHITLKDFHLESGKISFNALQKVADMLQTVAGGSLRLIVEGISSKQGPKPKWLEESLDFQLSGLEKGSTQLMVEAPLLKKSLGQPQIPLFGRNPESVMEYTGIDLALESFQQAFQETDNDDLLDKHLLKDMEKYRSLFSDSKASIESFIDPIRNDPKFIVEYPYVDKAYRDSYYHYFSTKLNSYPRNFFRISIFEPDMKFICLERARNTSKKFNLKNYLWDKLNVI